jgi:hypothetical protein
MRVTLCSWQGCYIDADGCKGAAATQFSHLNPLDGIQTAASKQTDLHTHFSINSITPTNASFPQCMHSHSSCGSQQEGAQ